MRNQGHENIDSKIGGGGGAHLHGGGGGVRGQSSDGDVDVQPGEIGHARGDGAQYDGDVCRRDGRNDQGDGGGGG